MRKATIEAIRAHAEREYPRECCGVVVMVGKGKEVYVPCKNVAEKPENIFVMDAEDYAAAEDMGRVTKVVHSHPNTPPQPSEHDIASCEQTGLPWVIVNWPTGEIVEFKPTGAKRNLLGREFLHGVSDCYSLVHDYYEQVCGIDLPTAAGREDDWWLKGQNLYIENFPIAGFVEVPFETLRESDVILMQIRSNVPNHAAIYLGNNIIMHHAPGRLSCREVFGGYWHKVTVKVLRHKELLNA